MLKGVLTMRNQLLGWALWLALPLAAGCAGTDEAETKAPTAEEQASGGDEAAADDDGSARQALAATSSSSLTYTRHRFFSGCLSASNNHPYCNWAEQCQYGSFCKDTVSGFCPNGGEIYTSLYHCRLGRALDGHGWAW
jgi:hypothetical protein